MSDRSFRILLQMLRSQRGSKAALSFVQGRLLECGEQYEDRNHKRGSQVLECEHREVLKGALQVMLKELQQTIADLESAKEVQS